MDENFNGHSSAGHQSIPVHVDTCLAWLKRARSNITYCNFETIVGDYGLHGTSRFFPFSKLTEAVKRDGRFDGFIGAYNG